jgi:hypothetical protein
MAWKQVIVIPREIPKECALPADIQDFIGHMVPAMREVIAASPLSTEYEDDNAYIMQSFIKFMRNPSKKSPPRWERYERHLKRKEPYPTWYLNRLCKYLSDNRAALAKTLRSNSFKSGTSRSVPQLSRTKLIVIYLRPSDNSPISCINIDEEDPFSS